ncbi:MAG: hypothetical protein FGM28_09005 [Limnohabitans sp.]|nr:hypothetical protein [Limnohabitans sp.]
MTTDSIQSLDVASLARQGETLAGTSPLSALPRLMEEADSPDPNAPVQWRLQGRSVAQTAGEPVVWLDLQVHTALPLTCQRCLTPVVETLSVARSFRFVADEETAAEEDETSEEDVLVLARDFDALGLVEDELLMALPLLAMHEECPSEHLQTLKQAQPPIEDAKPNPFAVLAHLKRDAG